MITTFLTVTSNSTSIANRYSATIDTEYGKTKLAYLKPNDDFISIWKYLQKYKAIDINNEYGSYVFDPSAYNVGMIYSSNDATMDNDFFMKNAEFYIHDLSDELLLYLSLKYTVTTQIIDWSFLKKRVNDE